MSEILYTADRVTIIGEPAKVDVTHWPGDPHKRMISSACKMCGKSAYRFFTLRAVFAMILLCDEDAASVDLDVWVEIVEIDGKAVRVL